MSSYVQSAGGHAFSGTTASASLTGVVAGHNIRVALAFTPATLTLSQISDGTNNYTLLTSLGTAHTYNLQMAYRNNAASGSLTVTATFTSAVTGANILIEEWSGDATGASIDDGSSETYTFGSTAGTNLPAGSITTTVSGDDIWTALFQAQGTAPNIPSGYTAASSNTDGSWWSAHFAQVSAGAINPTWTSNTGDNDNYVGVIAFKPLVVITPDSFHVPIFRLQYPPWR